MWMEAGLLTVYLKIRVNKFRFEGSIYNKEIENLTKDYSKTVYEG